MVHDIFGQAFFFRILSLINFQDAFGVCNYLSLYKALGDEKYLREAEDVVQKVYNVLGRKKGLRIGEAPDRDGQYFHYLTKWLFALNELAKIKPEYHAKAVELVKQVHPHFVIPRGGVIWKMKEDLSGPYPGYGLGGLDHYAGYTVYKLIDPKALSSEIGDMWDLIQIHYKTFSCTQDLGLGDMLWDCHFNLDEEWAQEVSKKCIFTLNKMWKKDGYFMRDVKWERDTILAFGNFGVSVGLQAHNLWPERVEKLNKFFETFQSGDKYDVDAITHVMYNTSLFPGVFLKHFNPQTTLSK